MPHTKLTGKKLLLLLLYSPFQGNDFNEPISGRTRLMKMVFLFKKEIWSDFNKNNTNIINNLPEFFPWHYGPFSLDLINDIEFLHNQKYIQIKQSDDSTTSPKESELDEYEYWIDNIDDYSYSDYTEETFSLTNDKGIAKAQNLWEALDTTQQKCLIDFKRIINKTPLSNILEYIYKKYQDKGYIDKSLIRERFLTS